MEISTLNIIVGIVYTILAIGMIFFNVRKTIRSDDSEEASTITSILVKLETINVGIAEIKAETTLIKKSHDEDHERIVVLEQSLKSAWKELDRMRGIHREDD